VMTTSGCSRHRRLRASLGLLLVAACTGEPSLDVAVRHPARYAVVRTVVTVYAGDDIRCSEIELGDRGEIELGAMTVDEVDAATGARLELGRLGGKSIVARGYDAQQRFVTAGCRDVGEIAGEMTLDIETGPTAVVAIDPGQPDRPFAERTILVNMSDTQGAPLEGMVSWQLTGPAGAAEQQPAAGVATRDGDAQFRVADLGTPGPQGLRIRVPWATAPLPLVTGFDLSRATTISLGTGAASHPSCDLRGHAGAPPTLVCLTPADAQGHRDVVEIAWQVDRFVSRALPIRADITNQFALFVDRDGSADEPIYVISATGAAGNWYRLGAAGAGLPKVFDGALQGVVYVPRCAGSATALVGVQTTGTALASRQQFFTPAGAPIDVPQDGEVISGGCVADVDGGEHQAVVLATPTGDAVLVLIGGPSRMTIPGAKLTGSGFVAVENQGIVEKRFAGTRLQATGTVVFEAVLAQASGSYKLVERSEVEAAAPPTKIVSGRLDRDDDTDLMWDMNAGLRRRVFQVSLAKRVAGVPLTAMTTGPVGVMSANAAAADFLVGDLDDQNTDEMVMFSAQNVTIFSPD
jgi:hypothetical protein